MAQLLTRAKTQGIVSAYIGKLLDGFGQTSKIAKIRLRIPPPHTRRP